MRVLKICFSVLAISLMTVFFAPSLSAQESLRSHTVTEYNGKKFYIHTVQKKQSLDDIAKIYDVTVYDILVENKDIKINADNIGIIIDKLFFEITKKEMIINNIKYVFNKYFLFLYKAASKLIFVNSILVLFMPSL